MSPSRRSGEAEPSLRHGDGPAQHARRLDPLADDPLGVGESGLVGGAVRGTAGQLRDFGDEGLVLGAPIEHDLIMGLTGCQRRLPDCTCG